MTFSIIGIDKKTGEIGVATATKAIACGAIVPLAKFGVGGVATQSYPNILYREKAISLLEKGIKPPEIINLLVKNDKRKEMRQVIVINARGESAGFTGKGNVDFAGHISGRDFICAGNMLAGKEVLDAVSKTFIKSKGNLADRLIKSLIAGEKVGGDKRNKPYGSASLFIVKKNKGPLGIGDRWIDLRIDCSATPIQDLKDLLKKRMKADNFFSSNFKY
ncbi:hypothetical protein A3K73_07140 [Candidatus Pacearchaeota archaeon RBG_13_36_9]|nr:MAG: hypothetical protein A3K73_07140 [Candidatus Pacearchaeota archaeon RBG_13_36_9]